MATPYLTTEDYDLKCLQQGSHHDPFVVLGCHPRDDHWVVRAWLPTATSASLEGGIVLQPLNNSGMFIAILSAEEKERLPSHYWVEWIEESGQVNRVISPYTFLPQVGELDLHLFAEGQHWNLYDILGANLRQVDGIDGVLFAVWAPSAERVSVVGNFNGWNGLRHPMRARGRSGVWELFIPGMKHNDCYKFEIRTMYNGHCVMKADPYARAMEMRPRTASIVYSSDYNWKDDNWLAERRHYDWQHAPISMYEVHLGSWQRDDNHSFSTIVKSPTVWSIMFCGWVTPISIYFRLANTPSMNRGAIRLPLTMPQPTVLEAPMIFVILLTTVISMALVFFLTGCQLTSPKMGSR